MSADTRVVEEATIEATIIRCRCGNPASHPDAVCPQGVAVPLGVVSYYHRNPLRRLWWRFTQWRIRVWQLS